MKSILTLTSEKQIRHRIKYLYRVITNIGLMRHQRGAFDFYIQALKTRNIRKLAFLERFGETPRHQLENLYAYMQSRRFGFFNMALDKYGWLSKPQWIHLLSFDLPSNLLDNKIILAEGNNHKWTYGISIFYTNSGSSFYPSIYGQSYDSKESCLKAAAYHAKRNVQLALDNPSFNQHKEACKLARNILTSLDELVASQTQLSLF